MRPHTFSLVLIGTLVALAAAALPYDYPDSYQLDVPLASRNPSTVGSAKKPKRSHVKKNSKKPSHRDEKPEESEKCEQVARGPLLCVVCRGPGSSHEREQCSYVARPNEQAYGYAKSSSFGRPEKKKKAKEQQQHRREPDSGEDQHPRQLRADDPEDASSPEEDFFGSGSSRSCRTVREHGQTCEICAEPGGRGTSRTCGYSRGPKNAEPYADSYDDEEPALDSEHPKSKSGPSDDGPASSDYIRSESERITRKLKGKSKGCREVRRDSMLCTVCKDPSTGDDFEQCEYSYDPADKVYAYSRSKSFGGPGKSPYAEEDEDEDGEEEDVYGGGSSGSSGSSSSSEETSSQPARSASESQLSSVYAAQEPEELKARVDAAFHDAKLRRAKIQEIGKNVTKDGESSKCKKVLRDGMTCYRCADGAGFSNEECVYVADADEPSAGDEDGKRSETTRKRQTRQTRQNQESEPYNFAAETRPVYDKVLGMAVPAYMLQKSSQELEFDEQFQQS